MAPPTEQAPARDALGEAAAACRAEAARMRRMAESLHDTGMRTSLLGEWLSEANFLARAAAYDAAALCVAECRARDAVDAARQRLHEAQRAPRYEHMFNRGALTEGESRALDALDAAEAVLAAAVSARRAAQGAQGGA